MNESSRVAAVLVTMCALGTSSLGARSPGSEAAAATRTVVGRVVDDAVRGIPGANVRASSGANTLSDSTGRFVVRNLPTGALQLVARKVGYDSASVAVSSDTTAEISIVLVRTHLLNGIVVEGKAYDRALWDNGFYHRQKVASGMFFDPDAIARFGGNGVGSLVQQVPRVEVLHQGNQDYAFSTIAGRPCRMNIYIDGMFQRVAMPGPGASKEGREIEGMGLNELISFRDVAAVEVYPRASAVPIENQRMGPAPGPQQIASQQIPSPTGMKTASRRENADAACGAIVHVAELTRPAARQTADPAGRCPSPSAAA